MYGRAGTLYLESHLESPQFHTRHESRHVAKWHLDYLVVPFRILDETHFLVKVGSDFKMLQLQYRQFGWTGDLIAVQTK